MSHHVHDPSNDSSEAQGWFGDTDWLDLWWPAFLILFGISFVLFLACFPQNY